MAEQETVTLLAEAGRQWEEKKEAIGTYDRSIVFLPKGVQPGERVRVVLEEIRADARGRMMYRGKPAPAERVERWQEKGSALERVEVSVDWKLQEKVIKTCESRLPTTREVPGLVATTWRIVWGSSLTDSYFERTVEKAFVSEIEFVQEGKLSWKKQGERRETGASEMILIQDILDMQSYWRPAGLPVVYPDATPVSLRFQVEDGGNVVSLDRSETWGSLPAWLQAVLLDEYPVCGCGRKRVDHKTPPADGYAKCQACRDDESCARCGATPGERPLGVTQVGGVLVCPSCINMAALEVIVSPVFTPERRERIARDAKRLLAAKALPSDVGQLVFEGGLGHIADTSLRSYILSKGAGLAWHYVGSDGVIEGSKFAPEALEVLQYFAASTGSGFVRLASWFVTDVYERTQVRGETVTIDQYLLRQLAYLGDDTFQVAKRLRGCEADRQAALDGYNRLAATLGESAPEVRSVLEALQGDSQDYALALERVRAAEASYQRKLAEEARAAQVRERLVELVQEHYPACVVCGGELIWEDEHLEPLQRREPYVHHVCPCVGKDEPAINEAYKALEAGYGEVESYVDGRTAKVLRRTTATSLDGNDVTVAELVAYYKYGGWNLTLAFKLDHLAVGEWRSETLWRTPSAPEREVFHLERLATTYPDDVARAEEEVRASDGDVLKLVFRRKTNDRSGQLEWVAGFEGESVRYVVAREHDKMVKEGKSYFCRRGRALVDKERFKLYLVHPYLQADLDPQAEIARIKGAQPASQDRLTALQGKFAKKR